VVLHVIMLNGIMICVYAVCWYADCNFTVRHSAWCYYDECLKAYFYFSEGHYLVSLFL
jgi:hypothetical protein